MKQKGLQNQKVLGSWFDTLGTYWYYKLFNVITLKNLMYGQRESWIVARAILLLASNVTESSAVEKEYKMVTRETFSWILLIQFHSETTCISTI